MFVPSRHMGRRRERKLESSSIFSAPGLCFDTGPDSGEGTVRQMFSATFHVHYMCITDGIVSQVMKGFVGLKKA